MQSHISRTWPFIDDEYAFPGLGASNDLSDDGFNESENDGKLWHA